MWLGIDVRRPIYQLKYNLSNWGVVGLFEAESTLADCHCEPLSGTKGAAISICKIASLRSQ